MTSTIYPAVYSGTIGNTEKGELAAGEEKIITLPYYAHTCVVTTQALVDPEIIQASIRSISSSGTVIVVKNLSSSAIDTWKVHYLLV